MGKVKVYCRMAYAGEFDNENEALKFIKGKCKDKDMSRLDFNIIKS